MKKGKTFMPHRHYNTPRIKESKGIQILTTVWMVPFLAFVIALWLVYQHYAKVGPTIEIFFKSNAGLVANQSQIKMRDVTVGMVTSISLSEDGKGVKVKASIHKEVAPYLNEKAKIWIVHPDVGSHGVSGLDTLLSGSYIKIHGVKEKETQHSFVGLEDPYIDNEAKGKYYKLAAPTSNDVTQGSNVYYRQVKIGRVERVEISPNGKQVDFTIFVEEKYTRFINKKSQFYKRSNFAMDFSQGKLDFNIAGVSQIVRGGISIYTPSYSISNEPCNIDGEYVFPVYKSLAEMKAKHLMTGAEDKVYKFVFDEAITKLEINSPIKFQGFQVGYVIDIESHFHEANQSVHSEVYAIIHTKAFGNGHQKGEKAVEVLVADGLKAQLNTTLPMVGAQFIDLVFDRNITASISNKEGYSLFPTIVQAQESGILDDVKKVITKLEQLPLENLLLSATKLIDGTNEPIQTLLKDLDTTVKSLDKLISNKSLNQLPNDLSVTIQTLETTLNEFQNLAQGYNADSQFSAELSLTLKELSLAAESIERVSRKLEKKPNALLLGDD